MINLIRFIDSDLQCSRPFFKRCCDFYLHFGSGQASCMWVHMCSMYVAGCNETEGGLHRPFWEGPLRRGHWKQWSDPEQVSVLRDLRFYAQRVLVCFTPMNPRGKHCLLCIRGTARPFSNPSMFVFGCTFVFISAILF